MAEIVHQAVLCHVKLLGPGVLDAVVQNNDSVCGHDNPRAFKKLRGLHRQGEIDRPPRAMETQALVEAIREQLKQPPGLRPLKIVWGDGDERKTSGR